MLDAADPWFIKMLAVVLGGYFLWSIQRVLNDFKNEVKGLKDTLRELFHRGDRHEIRLSRLEGRCDAMHGANGEHPGGRRPYDPAERLDG